MQGSVLTFTRCVICIRSDCAVGTTLICAFEGKGIISDFQSLKLIGWVGPAEEGPVSHSLTKTARERDEEMGVGGNQSWRGALRQEGGREKATCYFSILSCVRG